MTWTSARSVAAGIRRGWWWMVAAALLVGVGSAAVPTSTPVTGPHQANAPVSIRANGVTAAPGAEGVVATMRVAAGTTQVRADIARRAGIAEGAPPAVSILPTGTDRIDVTVADTDPDVALRTAVVARDAIVTAVQVDHRKVREASIAALREQLTAADTALAAGRKGSTDQQLAQAQRDTLIRTIATMTADPGPILVAGPDPVLSPTAAAPPPSRSSPIAAAVLALLVLTALAVAAPLARAARGKLPDAAPAEWVTRNLGVPTVELGPRRSPSLDLAELYRSRLRDLPQVTVVQLTRPTACDLGAELVRTAALNGDDRTHDDGTPGSRRIPDDHAAGDAPVVRTLRTPRIGRDTARALLDAGPTVVVVQTFSARRATMKRDVSLLRGIGADVVAAVVWRGRVPFDPARPWEPPGDDLHEVADRSPAPSKKASRTSTIPHQLQPHPRPRPGTVRAISANGRSAGGGS